MKSYVLLLIVLCLQLQFTFAQPIGNWSASAVDLPVYNYTGQLPVKAVDKQGNDAMLPEDPYFLLGNYRMTLLTHASGIYQLLTAERAWARVNAATQPNYGWNEASITLKNNQNILLTGLRSVAANPAIVQKSFGVGFARYRYRLPDGITCTRILSVKPSRKINTGNPAFVVTIVLTNSTSQTQQILYKERMLVHFVLNGTQFTQSQNRPVQYAAGISINQQKQTAIAKLSCRANTLLLHPAKNERS